VKASAHSICINFQFYISFVSVLHLKVVFIIINSYMGTIKYVP